ncbi:SPW repeat protein [Patescibacteria group bacterium]
MKNTIQFAWVSVLAGIWLIIAPFILSYSDRGATTNDIIIGAVIIVIGLVTLSGERYIEGKQDDDK